MEEEGASEYLSQQQSSQIFYDEEDLLGFSIWVAELELLVSSRRHPRGLDTSSAPSTSSPSGSSSRSSSSRSRSSTFGAYYILLQKLEATVETTTPADLKAYQRRCEDALIDILLSGAPPPVRRLICGILSKMYAVGDSLPLYSRVSSLQLFLGTKEAFESRKTSEDIRLGALELMTTLYYSHGRMLTVGVLETSSIAVKYCGRTCSPSTRKAGLKLLAATVEGVATPAQRGMTTPMPSAATPPHSPPATAGPCPTSTAPDPTGRPAPRVRLPRPWTGSSPSRREEAFGASRRCTRRASSPSTAPPPLCSTDRALDSWLPWSFSR